MSFKRLIQSFRDALAGLRQAFVNEQNFRVQTVCAAVVLLLAAFFPLRIWETMLIFLMVIFVLTMELLNTALEKLVDLLKPRLHNYVKTIKDIMAAAVFLSSLGALIVGSIIFLPYFIQALK